MLAFLVTGALAVLDTIVHMFVSVYPNAPFQQMIYDANNTLLNMKAGIGYALWFTPLGSIATFYIAWFVFGIVKNFVFSFVSYCLEHFVIAV